MRIPNTSETKGLSDVKEKTMYSVEKFEVRTVNEEAKRSVRSA